MKNPQTRAEMIGKYGCLAMCYLYCVGVAPESEGEMIKHVSTAMDKGLLDEECTVLNASKLLEHFTGKKFIVTKKAISDIKNIQEATPVRYAYNGKGHWVVVENGKIVFNSIANSVCVKYGKPDSARIISLR
ncbi:MAG: DUF261 family protein [Treponema sp.]|nr:DUF261 family protein [Treponema sp.]